MLGAAPACSGSRRTRSRRRRRSPSTPTMTSVADAARTGSRSAGTTARAARCRATSATRSPRRAARAGARPRRGRARRRGARARPRRPCRHVDGRRWCATCATASWSRSCSRSRSRSGRRSARRLFGSTPPTPFGHRRRAVAVPAQPAGRSSTRRRSSSSAPCRAAGADARHDGAGRGGDRHRLDLLGRRDVLHRGRGLLRGGRVAGRASCCSATGSRCAPAAAPTTRSARCSTWRRRRRS